MQPKNEISLNPTALINASLRMVDSLDQPAMKQLHSLINLPDVKRNEIAANNVAGYHGTSLSGFIRAIKSGNFPVGIFDQGDHFSGLYFAPTLGCQEQVFSKYSNNRDRTDVPASDSAAFKMGLDYAKMAAQDQAVCEILNLEQANPSHRTVASRLFMDFEAAFDQLKELKPEVTKKEIRKLVDALDEFMTIGKPAPVKGVLLELSSNIDQLSIEPAFGVDEGFRITGAQGLPLSYITAISFIGQVEQEFVKELRSRPENFASARF